MSNIDQQMSQFSNRWIAIICKRRLLPVLFICCGLLFSLMPSTLAQDKIMLFFYSAETNINNYKLLKMEFDSYLASLGTYEFQPFSDRKAFEQHIKGKEHSLLLLSSWHYTNIYQEYALKPVLVGARNGKKYQKRILVTTSKSADIDSIKAGQIASASSVQHTRSTLEEMFTAKDLVESFKILTVPKDIDALMSVGFGMAKAALITENALDTLKTVNPPLYKKMVIVAESEESLLLIVAVPESFATDAGKLVKIVQDMASNPNGKKRIKLLGFDGWQTLDSLDKAKLEG